MAEQNIVIPPDFPLMLAAYKAQRDTAVGIDFDTQEVRALYGAARESMAEETIRVEMAAALQIKIKQAQARLKRIMLLAESAEDKHELLHDAMNLEQTVMLASAMIQELENYGRA